MSSRDRILAKVRAGVAAGNQPSVADSDKLRRATVEQRLAAHERHLVPERTAGKSAAELSTIMRRWLELAGGEMIEVASEGAVPAAIADFLRRYNLPQRLRMGADKRLGGLPWSNEPQLELSHGPAERTDMASLTHALAAVAETGTMVVASCADNPVTLSFLPENNIVLVQRADVVGPLEDAITRVRTRADSGAGLPRTLNMISGPSRSADIGGIPVFGAHGPRRLCLIVIG